jgi:hypothetical protein
VRGLGRALGKHPLDNRRIEKEPALADANAWNRPRFCRLPEILGLDSKA